MTRAEKRNEKKKYKKDFANLCRIMKLYFPDFINWLSGLEKLRGWMIHALLRRRKFEDAMLLGKYWMVIFDATSLFHFKERHCLHCLKKALNKGTENEQAVYCHHVLEAKTVLGGGFVASTGTEFIENGNEDVPKNDCETKAFKRLADKLKKEYPRLNVCVLADSLDYNAMKCHYLPTQIAGILLQLYEKARPGIRKAKGAIKNISSDLLESFGILPTGEDISFIAAYGYVKAA